MALNYCDLNMIRFTLYGIFFSVLHLTVTSQHFKCGADSIVTSHLS